MMTVLSDYHEFAGRHPETGTIRNALAYQGVKAPHTGEALSEALLLGISGGITFGYFTFEYSGYPPHLVLLTRNTFDPMNTLLERLAIPQEVLQTSDSHKGETNLLEVLESGRPALVWADMFSLPHNDLPYDERNWGMTPLLAYGYEDDRAYLADRANQPVVVASSDLQNARSRVKKDKFRVMVLDAPDLSRLPAAVTKGIWQCINLFVEAPPKGKRDNFGLAALQYWAKMLINTRNKNSWTRYFAPGDRMWMALAGNVTQPGAFGWVNQGMGNSAERGMYADFLDEAAIILDEPGLEEAAEQFSQSEQAWAALAMMMLPENVPLFKQARDRLALKHSLFIEQGTEALAEIKAINIQLRTLQAEISEAFPMSDAEAASLRENLASQVLEIYDLERNAIDCLQSVMA